MKAKERRIARRLRKLGWSLRAIAKHVKCSKSAVSRWIEDIPLTKDQIARLKSNQDKGRAAAANHPNGQRLKWERIRNSIKAASKNEIPSGYSLESLKLVGTALYWGEGFNAGRNCVIFANSDPGMIGFMMLFFRRVCNVPENKFRGSVNIHPHLDIRKAEEHWSEISGIPLTQFHKPLLAVSKASKGKRDNLPLGTFRIVISDVYICSRIKGWIDGLKSWAEDGRLAQLVRASGLHPEGQRFKSSSAHH